MELRTRITCVLLVLCAASIAAAQGERFHVFAGDAAEGDNFGAACAVDGGLALIGAPLRDENGPNSGVAYVFDVATGAQLRRLVSSDNIGGDDFGRAVALDGGIALVGARRDGDLGFQSGSVYVFDVATGQQLRKLLPNDGAADDFFGGSVALSGNLALVGAANDDDLGSSSGSAYLFDVTTGQQLAKLLPSDGAELDLFGVSVGIDGTTAVVGAYLDDDLGNGSGAAYLFDATSGMQTAKLLPNDGGILDLFGEGVAISAGRALVGAPGGGDSAGAAYVFDATTGQQTAKLVPSTGWSGSAFGRSVALDGPVAVVGAYHAGLFGEEAGAAFRFNAATGAEIALVFPEVPGTYRWFGYSVAVGDGAAVLGAPLDSEAEFAAGSAWVFQVGFGPSFCDASDAALAACPCANAGAAETGCDNAQATGGVTIDVLEQTTNQAATLAGSGFPQASAPAAILLRSGALEPAPVPFGDGLRCVGTGSLVRLAAATASGGGSTHTLLHGAGPGVFHYQIWYRNTPATFCDPAAPFNLSSGVTLTW